MNCLASCCAKSQIDPPVDGDHAAVSAFRVARESANVGELAAVRDGAAARVVVLDDRARRIVELLDELARRAEVEQVVERQLLAVQLAHAVEQVRRRAGARVERGRLVRVLAVAQVDHLRVRVVPRRREAIVRARGEPRRDRRVVASRDGERLRREPLARVERQPTVVLAQLLERRLVVGRVNEHRREAAVLRRRADHRRPADVDVLDHFVLARVAARDRLLERVEVDADEIDLLDLLLAGRREVLIVVALGQQAGVEARVQRLHAPVQHLRKAREVLDLARRDACSVELARRAAGRDELDAEPLEAAREVDQTRACQRPTTALCARAPRRPPRARRPRRAQ